MNVMGINMLSASDLREDKDTSRVFAIGDVDGNLTLLKQALALVEAYPLAANDKIVLMGNYIGDGGSTRDMVNFLQIYKSQREKQFVMLRGLNEHKLITMNDKFLRSPSGISVVNSYRRSPNALVPMVTFNNPVELDKFEGDIKWLSKQPCFHLSKQYVFVHSGLEPNKPLSKQDTGTVLFIQRPFHRSTKFWTKDFGDDKGSAVMVVHSNSTSDSGKVEIKLNRIDVGAAVKGEALGVETPVVVLVDNKVDTKPVEILKAFTMKKETKQVSMVPEEDASE